MYKYIERLVKCGYTKAKAYELCCDFIRNLSLFDLENFVISMEKAHVY